MSRRPECWQADMTAVSGVGTQSCRSQHREERRERGREREEEIEREKEGGRERERDGVGRRRLTLPLQ